MNIAIFGTGYVGLVTGACLADFGMLVTCVDTDEEKIAGLDRGQIPIYEPGLEFLVRKNIAEKRLSFTTDSARAIRGALVVMIAVGTPQGPDGRPDLSAIEQVAWAIGRHMDGYKVVATKSTVPAGTGRWIGERIRAHQEQPIPFDIVSNPEFLREGAAVEDFMRPDRIVVGAQSQQAIAIMKDVYSPLYLIETPFIVTDVESAEVIKYASNAFLATKISFINEVARLCERVGADVHDVARGMGLDKRIGSKFLHPGPGYGGSCFPKDTLAFAELGRRHDSPMTIVESVIGVNQRQRAWALEKVCQALGTVQGATVALAGLAFKPNTDDMREAPSIDIARGLMERGASVRAFDPAAMGQARRIIPGVAMFEDLISMVEGADGLVLVTEWNQFRKLDLPEVKRRLRRPIVVDLRNICDPKTMVAMGFCYTAVGRRIPAVGPAQGADRARAADADGTGRPENPQ